MTNKIFFTSIGVIINKTGTAAWYATMISCLSALAFFFIIYLLLKRFPGKDVLQIYEAVLGKPVGKILACVFCMFAIYYSSSTLREFVEMIKTYNLPVSPTSIIMLTFLLTAVIITYFGFQGLSRVGTLCFIPVLAVLAAILILASPSYNVKLLNPIGGHGLMTTAGIGFLRSSAYMEFSILTIVTSAIGGHKNYKKIGLISILLTGLIFVLCILCDIMTFGYPSGSENISGMFELSRSIYFNRFFQRVESFFIFAWVISSVIATSVSFYIGILIYCKTFKIKQHKPLILPFAILVFIVAMFPSSMQEVIQINIIFLREYSMFLIYIPPSIVLLLSIILGKRGQEQ
jgi:spore germination protein (amino acid permease)